MFRPSWKFLLVALIVVVTLAAAAPQADAGWWHRTWACCGGWYGPVWNGCWDNCCYGGCYRPVYRGCCGGWNNCCGDPCWNSGWDTWCCGTVVSNGVAAPSGVPTPAKKPTLAPIPAPGAAPAEPAAPGMPALPPADVPAAPKGGSTYSPGPENSGLLTIWVPAEAKVTVNGLATKSTGSKRQFVSFGLKPGFSYKYLVKAEIVREGQSVTEERTIVLTAGDRNAIAFGFNKPVAELAASKQ